MTKLRTAQAARDDIRDIRRFSKSTFGVRVARDYLGGLIDVFNLIEANPRIGALDSELGENIRSFGYRSHRIYMFWRGTTCWSFAFCTNPVTSCPGSRPGND